MTMPASTFWIVQVCGLYIMVWYIAFRHMVSPASDTASLDPDPDPATIAPPTSGLSPSPTPVSIVTDDAYLSRSDGFHGEDRVILVSRLRCPAQTIRLRGCVESDKISGIGHVTRLGRIHGRYIFLDVSFSEHSDDAIVVLCAHVCDVDLSFYRRLEAILRMQLGRQVHYVPAWIVNRDRLPFHLEGVTV
ncbi:hypothetical protein EDD85DRAFT_848898 [Armillaria nabsnona]|nr:hypothetical protein EDD85DRAFT_848898 [Armillaria nabsnona]